MSISKKACRPWNRPDCACNTNSKQRGESYAAAKLIHGYGSSGAGGSLRTELQKELHKATQNDAIRAFIAGENWRLSDQSTWEWLKRFPEFKKDPDLGKNNQGISIVIF